MLVDIVVFTINYIQLILTPTNSCDLSLNLLDPIDFEVGCSNEEHTLLAELLL